MPEIMLSEFGNYFLNGINLFHWDQFLPFLTEGGMQADGQVTIRLFKKNFHARKNADG